MSLKKERTGVIVSDPSRENKESYLQKFKDDKCLKLIIARSTTDWLQNPTS
jgi:hypothetical protein